jgi:predicted ATPase/DNA-binding winged helix-turn-helix (wHTH) protein
MNRLRVGAFELYPSERTLCASGKPVELGARAFDLLLVLVEQHGRLVTKSTLIERVWPRLVVDENNLPAQIASLRRILGAGAIRTVPGYGYRLELQVAADEATADAARPPERVDPPPLSVPRRSWPQRLGPLIGRDEDLRRVCEALERSNLVTLVGMAGIGKTRLAQQVLAREAEKPGSAVAWIALESLEEPQHVASAIALAVGVSLPDGVAGFAALRQALERVPLLLILDCAEHLGAALAAPLSELISQTQSVRALVTSQAPLGVAGETVYRLAVLPVPSEDTPQVEAARYAAVELFARRVAAADQRFELSGANTPLVVEICRRLDGIPLALELAAARVPALGLTALLERLDDRFRLLKTAARSTDPRHDALHAAFDWSYGLLTPSEQRVFNRLGAFASSFSLNAAARCVADQSIDTAEAIDLIGRLVDRSLVTVLAVDPPRYALLETHVITPLRGSPHRVSSRRRARAWPPRYSIFSIRLTRSTGLLMRPSGCIVTCPSSITCERRSSGRRRTTARSASRCSARRGPCSWRPISTRKVASGTRRSWHCCRITCRVLEWDASGKRLRRMTRRGPATAPATRRSSRRRCIP